MDPNAFWSVGDYGIVGDLWGSSGRDLASALDAVGQAAIDLATGTGVTAIVLAQRGAASVIGVDITPPLLAEAASRASAADVDIRWVEADECAVPLPSASADIVTSTFGLAFTSWSPNGLFGGIRRAWPTTSPRCPSPGTSRSVASSTSRDPGPRWSRGRSSSASGSLIATMERWSAPIVLAVETLGDRWPSARDALDARGAAAGAYDDGAYRVQVPYPVTTLVG